MVPVSCQSPCFLTLFGVWLLGVGLAAFANYCVDRIGWTERFRSPWRRFPRELVVKGLTPTRVWIDYLPIMGWFSLARLGTIHRITNKRGNKNGKKVLDRVKTISLPYASISGLDSRFFWLRPACVEFLFACWITWRFYYWFTFMTSDQGWTFSLFGWGIETLLFWICLCASLVDLDDFVIPDCLMIPGVCLGLIFAVLNPLFVFATSPVVWPLDLAGKEHTTSFCFFVCNMLPSLGFDETLQNARLFTGGILTIAWSFWAFALLDRRFYLRLGIKRAFVLFWRRLRQSPLTKVVACIWGVGLVGIWFVACRFAFVESYERIASVNPLDSLASAFLGLVVGASMIWAVRLIGGSALGVEAMGFGDVILAGMLGVYLGWVGAVVVFFIAPFVGLIFGALRRGFSMGLQIPYGPFLCLGALIFVARRRFFYNIAEPYISDPLFTLSIGLVGCMLLAFMLLVLRTFKKKARSK